MSYNVYKVERAKAGNINEITSDEIVSRTSITTRDAEILGVVGDCVYVLIEGREEALERATELFQGKLVGRKVPGDLADQVKAAIDAEENAAAEGMGALFG